MSRFRYDRAMTENLELVRGDFGSAKPNTTNVIIGDDTLGKPNSLSLPSTNTEITNLWACSHHWCHYFSVRYFTCNTHWFTKTEILWFYKYLPTYRSKFLFGCIEDYVFLFDGGWGTCTCGSMFEPEGFYLILLFPQMFYLVEPSCLGCLLCFSVVFKCFCVL